MRGVLFIQYNVYGVLVLVFLQTVLYLECHVDYPVSGINTVYWDEYYLC
jgi:hypothetical protein